MEKMIVNIFVFTSPTCSHCHHTLELLRKLDRDDIKIQEISTATEEGLKLARENEITSVPVIFISSNKNKEVIGLKGTPSITEINKAIDVCLGNSKIE